LLSTFNIMTANGLMKTLSHILEQIINNGKADEIPVHFICNFNFKLIPLDQEFPYNSELLQVTCAKVSSRTSSVGGSLYSWGIFQSLDLKYSKWVLLSVIIVGEYKSLQSYLRCLIS